MIVAGLVGVAILSCAGIFKWKEADDVIVTGMRMMALVGFTMIAAQGFAAVIEATNQVPELVKATAGWIGDSKALAAFVMLLVGLLITLYRFFIFYRTDPGHPVCAIMFAVWF